MPEFLNSDTLSQHVVKLNQLDSDLGTRSSLITTDNTDVVSAINSLVSRFDDIDSTGVLSVDMFGMGDLQFDSVGNVLTLFGPILDPSTGLNYDSATNVLSGTIATTSTKGIASFATANFSVSTGAVSIKDGGIDGGVEVASNTITYDRFNSVVSLVVYDSAGSSVKTIFSPGA